MLKHKNIQYKFLLPDKQIKTFDLKIDLKEFLSETVYTNKPDWCKLENNKCSHCPFNSLEQEYCPVALNLVDIVDDFGEILSYLEVKVQITTEERQIVKLTSAQTALSSLMGLYIATSNCPITDFFKPMAWYHLPFASYEETLIRAVATYFLEQYFKYKEGKKPDIDLQGLSKIYHDIQILNKHMAKRLKSACVKDSPINALVSLDIFAQCFPLSIENTMNDIKFLFKTL
jgi:hypothetical protein